MDNFIFKFQKLFVHRAFKSGSNTEFFFWSVFSCIAAEYGDLRRKSPYSVRMQENTAQRKLRIWTLFTQWLSCIFPAFAEMLLHNMEPLIKILYLDLRNLNNGILELNVGEFVCEKYVWRYVWVGLTNLFWNIFDAVWDLILFMKTWLFKMSS